MAPSCTFDSAMARDAKRRTLARRPHQGRHRQPRAGRSTTNPSSKLTTGPAAGRRGPRLFLGRHPRAGHAATPRGAGGGSRDRAGVPRSTPPCSPSRAATCLRLLQAGALGSDTDAAPNVSAATASLVPLEVTVPEALPRAGLSARHLVIEVTETSVMSDVERAAAELRSLSSTGVRIAVDDFGTGYSSLADLNPAAPRHPQDRPVLRGGTG